MKKIIFIIILIISSTALFAYAVSKAYISGTNHGKRMSASERVFEAQQLYMGNQSDTNRALQYIDAVIDYAVKYDDPANSIVDPKILDDAIKRHVDSYGHLFVGTKVYEVSNNRFFIQLDSNLHGTVKVIEFKDKMKKFIPLPGESGSIAMQALARNVAMQLTDG